MLGSRDRDSEIRRERLRENELTNGREIDIESHHVGKHQEVINEFSSSSCH